MNKYNIIKAFSNKAKELSEEDLLEVGDYIDSIIENRKKNNNIDKQSLLKLLNSKGISNLQQLAVRIRNANLIRGSVGGYTGRSVIIKWLVFNLDCTTIQAEALIHLMFILGYAEISYNDNFRIRNENL